MLIFIMMQIYKKNYNYKIFYENYQIALEESCLTLANALLSDLVLYIVYEKIKRINKRARIRNS